MSEIGVFDSGIGGVTVLRELLKVMPNEEYVYYSDSGNNPYGDKSEAEVQRLADNIVQRFLERGCKCIVIACNTASAIASAYLRKKYPNILIFAIEPAYKMVWNYAPNGETVIMATDGTIKSERFNLLYNKYNNKKTTIMNCKGLANIIEKGDDEAIDKYLKKHFAGLEKVENIVLGCTHYPLIKDKISKTLNKKVRFFDGAPSMALHVKHCLEEYDLLDEEAQNKITFIDSSESEEVRIQKEKRFYELLGIKQ